MKRDYGTNECGMRNREWDELISSVVPFHIPHSTFHIPHSAFRIPHSAFRIPHSAFRIPHSAFRIPHSAFRISHSAIIMATANTITGSHPIRLNDFDPDDDSGLSREDGEEKFRSLSEELTSLQELLYAASDTSVLIILQ